MNHLFIVNPAAGKGKALKLMSHIENTFANQPGKYNIEITERPGHAEEIARKYVSSSTYRVYSVGGDGTLNEVLNGMANSSSTLAVIPCGSGNDFIKSAYGSTNPQEIISKLPEAAERTIDLAKVNGKYFLNISSLGFDADVVYNAINFKKIPLIHGSLAYLLSILITMFKYNNNFLHITVDKKHIETKSLLIAIANGKYYGGGMLAAPHASIDDGLFDICLIHKKTRAAILKFFPRFIKGQHLEIEGVSYFQGSKVEIECENYISMNIDGEVERVKKAVFEIIPKGIRIAIPQL